MKLHEILRPENVLLDVPATGKLALLEQLSSHISLAAGHSHDAILQALLRRENLGSTGTGGGIALPHARFATLSQPLGVLARLRRPIEFEAVDGTPVDIAFLALLPEATGQGLNALAFMARRLRTDEILRVLRRETDPQEIYNVLAAVER